MTSTASDDQTAVLHDGRADVSYIRMPADQSGLQVQALLAEPRVAVLPAGHRLTGKDTIAIADLADEHLLQDPGAVPEWRDIATEMRTRHRRSAPVFRTVEENRVSGGALPDSADYRSARWRPDVVAIGIRGPPARDGGNRKKGGRGVRPLRAPWQRVSAVLG